MGTASATETILDGADHGGAFNQGIGGFWSVSSIDAVNSPGGLSSLTDGVGTAGYVLTGYNVPTVTLSYTGTSPFVVNRYVLASMEAMDVSGESGRDPRDWTFEGWNGTGWVTLDTRSNQTLAHSGSLHSYDFVNTTTYASYRLNVSANNGGNRVNISEFDLYSVVAPSTAISDTVTGLLDLTSVPSGPVDTIHAIALDGNGAQTVMVSALAVEALAPDTRTLRISGDAADRVSLSGGVWTDGGTSGGWRELSQGTTHLQVQDGVGVSGTFDGNISGGDGNDTLDGGVGNDTLAGGGGADTYLFGIGGGQDVIDNTGHAADGDKLLFGSNIAKDQLWFQQSVNDLKVSVIGSSDSITVAGWFAGNANHVASLQTADGKTLSNADVQNLVAAMATLTPPPVGQMTLTADQHQQLDSVIAANWH